MKAALLALTVLLAGCLSADEGPLAGVDHAEPLYHEATGLATDAGPQARTIELAQASGGVFGPGVLPLDITIEDELVYDVRWEITAAPNMLGLTGVRGHGCEGLAWGGGASPESTTRGNCDAMSRGTVQLEAFFEIPVAYYSLSVRGTVDVNETAQPSSASSLP